jgi:hypothetical protein
VYLHPFHSNMPSWSAENTVVCDVSFKLSRIWNIVCIAIVLIYMRGHIWWLMDTVIIYVCGQHSSMHQDVTWVCISARFGGGWCCTYKCLSRRFVRRLNEDCDALYKMWKNLSISGVLVLVQLRSIRCHSLVVSCCWFFPFLCLSIQSSLADRCVPPRVDLRHLKSASPKWDSCRGGD